MSALCVHPHVSRGFAGRLYFDAGACVDLSVVFGTYSGLDPSMPVSLDVELPQSHAVPWWFRAYVSLAGNEMHLDGIRPRVTARVMSGPAYSIRMSDINCDRWELDLPWLPVVSLESVIGKLPLHFVVRQGGTEHCRFVLQRRCHCTRLAH